METRRVLRRAGWWAACGIALVQACTPTTGTECTADDQCTAAQACRNNRCETRPDPLDGGLSRPDASVAGGDAGSVDAAMQQSDAGLACLQGADAGIALIPLEQI